MPSIVAFLGLFGVCSDDPQLRPVLPPFNNIEAFHREHVERWRRSIAFMESMIAFDEFMMDQDPKRFPVEQARQMCKEHKEELGKMRRMLREHELWTPPPGGVFTSPSQLEEMDRAAAQRRKLFYELWPPAAPMPREVKK